MDIKKIIKEELQEVFSVFINEANSLKSKSAKGNRYFDMLKTAKFQHYDMPKGQLVSFSHGEEDRKRIVSQLSQEDKKNYREWLKTPEGIKSIKLWDAITKSWNTRFPDSKKNLSESEFKIDKYGDSLMIDNSWPGLNITVPEYKTKVKDSLVQIIMEERGISEKNFSRVDEVISEVSQLFKSSVVLNHLIQELEKGGSRPQYVAEKIYNDLDLLR